MKKPRARRGRLVEISVGSADQRAGLGPDLGVVIRTWQRVNTVTSPGDDLGDEILCRETGRREMMGRHISEDRLAELAEKLKQIVADLSGEY